MRCGHTNSSSILAGFMISTRPCRLLAVAGLECQPTNFMNRRGVRQQRMSVDGDTSGDWLWADWVVGGGCVMRRETSVMSLAADFPTPVEGSGAGTRVGVTWVFAQMVESSGLAVGARHPTRSLDSDDSARDACGGVGEVGTTVGRIRRGFRRRFGFLCGVDIGRGFRGLLARLGRGCRGPGLDLRSRGRCLLGRSVRG